MKLPLTVIGGYLGAGKTTLINRLLAEDHGLRLLIMVNDFGAINVDASLIAAADDDMISLSNGCVCCTMGADLFLAIGDVLDQNIWPDHLIIEASGIADPARIAQVALAEPDLDYGGIVTVVDTLEYDRLCIDPQIGAQVRGQVDVADVVAVSKTEGGTWPHALGREAIDLAGVDRVAPIICGMSPSAVQPAGREHSAYLQWSCNSEQPMTRERLMAKLQNRPAHLFRVKGFVPASDGGMWQVQCVGQQIEICAGRGPEGLVGIALRGRVTSKAIEAWWKNDQD